MFVRTHGLDIVMNGHWSIHKSILDFSLAATFTQTRVFGDIQTTNKLPANTLNTNTLFNREEKEKLEHGQPASKIIFSANYKRDKIEFLIRNTRFGKTSAVFNSLDIMQDEFFSAKILTDLSISYSPKSWFRITAGANNIFDIYPDPLKNPINKNQGILIYSNEAMPFGYNGGYYFLNMSFTL
jgi:iron complex outermembrane receptor protein